MIRNFLAATVIAFSLTLPAAAADPVQQNNSNAVWFENWIGLSNALLRVASPEGDIIDIRAEQGTPVFELPAGQAVDGVWRYELRAATEEMVKNRDYNENDTLNSGEEYIPKALYRTGFFMVERGVIIRPEDMPQEEEKSE
jgi:hypothetical protein